MSYLPVSYRTRLSKIFEIRRDTLDSQDGFLGFFQTNSYNFVTITDNGSEVVFDRYAKDIIS
jgi:hypothetical protein